MPMPDEDELGNLFVRQKDQIIKLIDSSENVHDFDKCRCILLIVREMWQACDYGYKLRELGERLSLKEQAYFTER